jgi:polar amino acid transport system substrate-binding protein
VRPPRRRLLDCGALVVLGAYLALWLIAGGSGGASLDRSWARVRASGELRVAIDLGFAPFSAVANGAVIGYDADLARALAGHLGLRVVFQGVGFDALYDALARQEADMIASALTYAPGQGWRARFSRVYFNAGQVLLARADAGLPDDAPLNGLHLGASLGSDGDTLLRRAEHQGLPLTRQSDFDEPAALIAALRAGTLDAVIVDNATALAAIHDDKSLRLLRALSFEPYVLAVPPDAYQLQAHVDAALEALERAGCLEALNQRWFRTSPPDDTRLPPACQ